MRPLGSERKPMNCAVGCGRCDIVAPNLARVSVCTPSTSTHPYVVVFTGGEAGVSMAIAEPARSSRTNEGTLSVLASDKAGSGGSYAKPAPRLKLEIIAGRPRGKSKARCSQSRLRSLWLGGGCSRRWRRQGLAPILGAVVGP